MKVTGLLLSLIFLRTACGAQTLEPVAYADSAQALRGFATTWSEKKLPGVVILPAWKGIDSEAKTAALLLAKQGYSVFIADIYGVGNEPTDNESASKQAGYYKANVALYQRRIQLAINALIQRGANAAKIAVIGYCFGGTGALEAARGGLPVTGVVSIHGGLGRDENRLVQPIRTKLLVEHPAEDKSVTPEQYAAFVKEMKESKADWQIITYANCGHTFTNPESKDYNPVMASRAWQHTLLFLQEVLQ